MQTFDSYRSELPHVALQRRDGVLEARLRSDDHSLVFDGLWTRNSRAPFGRLAMITSSAPKFGPTATTSLTPSGFDKILREELRCYRRPSACLRPRRSSTKSGYRRASRALRGTAPRECGVRSKPGSARVRRRRVSAAPPEPRRSSGRCRRGDAPRNRGRRCIRSCRCAPPRQRANPYYNIRNWDVERAFIPPHRGHSRQKLRSALRAIRSLPSIRSRSDRPACRKPADQIVS